MKTIPLKHMLALLCAAYAVCTFHAQTNKEIGLLTERYVRMTVGADDDKQKYFELLGHMEHETEVSDQSVVELEHLYPIRATEVEQILKKQKADGSWTDINYADKKRSGWEPKQHAERTLLLTKYHFGHPDARTGEAIHRALNFWFTQKPQCLNWWYNQIGIPRTLGPAFLLFREEMTKDELSEAIRLMKNSRFGMTGQNKVWLAGNVLIRALLENDARLMQQARDTICSEIVAGQAEGIQKDWSFHQHGPQQQFGNYGLAFLNNMSFYAELFADTSLKLSDRQLDILVSFLLEGYRWILWNGRMDINCLNRQLFHNADIHKGLITLFAASSLLKSCRPDQKCLIKRFIDENFLHPARRNSFTGHKHFEESDMTVYRTPHWMASIRMASDRIIGTELINEDNLNGYYMADGACYTYVGGDEYHNVFPLWDWRRIPGITTYDAQAAIPRIQGKKSRNHSRMVGGSSAGKTGITAMQLNRNGLRANKCWICTEDYILCLGSNIAADSTAPLLTTVEQSLLRDSVWQDGKGRYFHNRTGYIILQADSCRMSCDKRSGRWHDFMGMYSPEFQSEGSVFSLTLHHPARQRSSYQYVLLPATTARRTAAFNPSRLRILRNDETVQAAYLKKHYFVAAYGPVSLRLGNKEIEIRKAGTYIYTSDGTPVSEMPFPQ